jgi:hypothetical protein
MVADFLSSKLKTKVVINSFSIGYLGARIKGVELYDEKDTLVLSINELHLKYNSLRQSPRNLKISFMEITRPYLNMVRHGRGESFSYEVLIRRLFPPSEGESSSKFSVRKYCLKTEPGDSTNLNGQKALDLCTTTIFMLQIFLPHSKTSGFTREYSRLI